MIAAMQDSSAEFSSKIKLAVQDSSHSLFISPPPNSPSHPYHGFASFFFFSYICKSQCPLVADFFIDYSKKVVELNSKAEMGLKEVLFLQHDKNESYEQE